MFFDSLYQFLHQLPVPVYLIAILYPFIIFLLHLIIFRFNSQKSSPQTLPLNHQIGKLDHRYRLPVTLIQTYLRQPLSWAWPLFVVLPISLIYFYSPQLINQLNQSIQLSGYLSQQFPILYPWLQTHLQSIIWIIALGFGIRALILPLKHQLWFNRSRPLRALMVLYSDFILSYIAIFSIANLLTASIGLYLYLGNYHLTPNYWDPDLNYGLQAIPQFITHLFIITIGFSLMPLIMVFPAIRKTQTICPPAMYYSLTATALITALLLFVLLVPRYNQQINYLNQSLFQQIIREIESDTSINQQQTKLQAYISFKTLDNQYHVPIFFSSVVAIRSFYFLLELQTGIFPFPKNVKRNSFFRLFSHLKKFLNDLLIT